MAREDYKLVVFDGDETVINGDIISELGRYAGVTEELEAITDRVWADELDPMEALTEHIFPLFEGIPLTAVEELVGSLQYTPGAEVVGCGITCRSAIFTALAPLADRIAGDLDMEATYANNLVVEDGLLTGELEGDMVRVGKGPLLDDLVASLGIDHNQVIAIGDGPQDRPLFTRAGFSVGIQPKAAVADVPDLVVPEQTFYPAVPALRNRGVLDTRDERHGSTNG